MLKITILHGIQVLKNLKMELDIKYIKKLVRNKKFAIEYYNKGKKQPESSNKLKNKLNKKIFNIKKEGIKKETLKLQWEK